MKNNGSRISRKRGRLYVQSNPPKPEAKVKPNKPGPEFKIAGGWLYQAITGKPGHYRRCCPAEGVHIATA